MGSYKQKCAEMLTVQGRKVSTKKQINSLNPSGQSALILRIKRTAFLIEISSSSCFAYFVMGPDESLSFRQASARFFCKNKEISHWV